MKIFRSTIIGLVVLAFLWIIYFGTQISATYPPIKIYDCVLTGNELYQTLLGVVSKNPSWTFAIRDTTGQVHDQRYYCDLYKRTSVDSLTFGIFFQETDRLFDKETKSELGLVSAWDNIKLKGGYKIEDPEVRNLVKVFEAEIIRGLKSNSDPKKSE